MSFLHKVFALILLGSLLVTGCGSVKPTVTPLPAATTQVALEPTHTLPPPTAAPALPTVPSVATFAKPSATSTEIAPVTQDWAESIGADGYAGDVVIAVELAKRLLS